MSQVTHDSETPADRQQVVIATAFIHADFDGTEKVFLPRRAETKKFLPGLFELPGGHIDFGEDIEFGLKREINEEFGVDINVGDPFFAFTYVNEVKQFHSVEVVYFAKFVGSLNEASLRPEDHSESKWFTEEECNQVVSQQRPADDPEFLAMRRGFSLLKGSVLDFG